MDIIASVPKNESRMKRIFLEMDNSETTIQTFYEQLEKEFGIYCHSIDRYCFLDFYDLTRNKIIEFNGNYWHANPLLFESDSIINFPNKTYQKACDIWKSDQVRLNAIKEEMNCEILVIWESDFNKNKEKSINDCISFLLKES